MASLPVRQIIQSVELLDSAAYTVVTVRQDIQSSQGKDKEHMRCPHADAFDFDQGFNDGIVGESRHSIQWQRPIAHSFRKIENIGCLLF